MKISDIITGSAAGDAGLVEMCETLAGLNVKHAAAARGGDDPLATRLGRQMERLADQIASTEPKSTTGLVAKAQAAWLLACQGGQEPRSAGIEDVLALSLLRDLLRPSGLASAAALNSERTRRRGSVRP
jgi:hypothetical protein